MVFFFNYILKINQQWLFGYGQLKQEKWYLFFKRKKKDF